MAELLIPRGIFDEMIAHCKRGYPHEACGILAGKGNQVSVIYPMTNVEQSPVSYLMESSEQFRVMEDMRRQGLGMVAIFHSHPASPPYPSQRDVSLAFYDDSVYVIVSLAGEKPTVKGFAIRDGRVAEVALGIREEEKGEGDL